MVKRNIPRKAQKPEKKSEKDTKAENRAKAIAKAELYVGKGNVIICNTCGNPKVPDVLRVCKDKLKGFCNCGGDSLFREEYCYEIVNWFREKRDEFFTDLEFFKIDPEGEAYLDDEGNSHGGLKKKTNKQIIAHFPTFEERSTNHYILESTRAKWCDLFPQFDEACKMCKQIQYYILIKGGLNNTFNSNIVKMLGSHYFGISETLKIGSVDGGTTEEEMERINKFLSSNQQRNDEPNEVV